MRRTLVFAFTLVALMTSPPAPAAEPASMPVDLSGTIDGRGLVLAESDKPVFRLQLAARVDKNGEGAGTIILDPTPPAVDEFGFPAPVTPVPPVQLECTLKFVKKQTMHFGPVG